jgi:rod shape-determining protein MreD
MSDLLKNIIRFALFILVQVFILNQVPPLHRFIVPYLYYLYILWLPFTLPRVWLSFVSFLFGLTLDYFMNTPGLHAAACTLIAYIRPFIINLLISQEGSDKN